MCYYVFLEHLEEGLRIFDTALRGKTTQIMIDCSEGTKYQYTF